MTIAPAGPVKHSAMAEPAELLIKEAREESRRRRLWWVSMCTVFVAACLLALGVVHYTSSSSKTSSGHTDSTAFAVTCNGALVKLLGVSAIPGGGGHAGLLVRTSVTSSTECSMRGYAIVAEKLADHATATASDMRLGYLGGFAKIHAPLPRLEITSRARDVSFTIQMPGCDGPRPRANAFQITLPGSRGTLTARSAFEGGVGIIKGFGIYCGKPFVTPLVKGSSGSVDWR